MALGEKVTPVPNWSAYRLRHVGASILLGACAAMVACGVGAVAVPGRSIIEGAVVGAVLSIAIPAIFVSMGIVLVANRRADQEVLAGYTTLQGKFLESSQVDPNSFHVIRAAGSPYLNSAEWKAAIISNRRDGVGGGADATSDGTPGAVRHDASDG